MKKSVIYILLLFIISFSLRGQDVKVTSAFDSSRIYIGDQIKFTISVDQPADMKLAFPIFKDTLFKNIEIIAGPVTDTSASEAGRIKVVEKYLITSFDSGYYEMPPVFVELKNEDGLKRFYSDYTQLEVMRVRIAPADTTAKIYDIIQPYRAPLTAMEILPWALVAFIIGLVIWAAIKYLPRLKKEKIELGPLINPDPAHVIAFRELEKLKTEQIWQQGEVKLYYSRLTEILRQYLENRYGVFSLELTTGETLDALLKSGFKKDELYKNLKSILSNADLVKFAKFKPEPEDNEAEFKNSWDFVLATKKVEDITDEIVVNSKKEEGQS